MTLIDNLVSCERRVITRNMMKKSPPSKDLVGHESMSNQVKNYRGFESKKKHVFDIYRRKLTKSFCVYYRKNMCSVMEWTGFGPVPEICQMFVRGHEFRGRDNGIVPTLMSKRVEIPCNAGKI